MSAAQIPAREHATRLPRLMVREPLRDSMRKATSVFEPLTSILMAFQPVGVRAQTRIMPLGDSVIEAYDGYVSHRYWLWHELTAGGYLVDFVVRQIGVRGTPLCDDFDQDCEGHWGRRADQILVEIVDIADSLSTHESPVITVDYWMTGFDASMD